MKNLLLLSLIATASLGAVETRTIENPLGQDWPWELVSMDFPAGTIAKEWVVTLEGVTEPRPLQIESVTVNGKASQRVWFIASVDAKLKSAVVTFAPGSATTPLQVSGTDNDTLVDTGVAQMRLRLGTIPAGTPLDQAPHWLGGLRVHGDSTWDGRARFDGTAPLQNLEVTTTATGPVFAEWHLRYIFAEAGRDGDIDAVPLMLGKQSFRYEPNQVPSETIAKEERRYEVAIRAIAGHPWIEIAERYHLPRDPKVKGWGISQYTISLGKPTTDTAKIPGFTDAGIPLDTMLWTRWFEYDSFGGNNNQLADPARPRAVQKGRPFAQLRPRWSQSPAGAQDCLTTSGGSTGMSFADLREKVENQLQWISKEAAKGDKADKRAKPYLAQIAGAQTAFAAVKTNDDTARVALVAVGAQVGLQLSSGVGYDPQAPLIGVIAAYPSKWVGPYDATITVQAFDGNRASYRFPLTDGGTNLEDGRKLWYGNRCYALIASPRGMLDNTKKIDSLIRRTSDWTLTALINRYQLTWPGMGTGKVGPNPGQYLGRRYQCDDVNPTNYGNRRMVNQEFEKNIGKTGEFGRSAAVCGYIYTDLDCWPGWHNGWGPGNPNFHTDKYMAAIFAPVAIPEHPDAQSWLAFGRSCLDKDLAKVLIAPDGVGSECPGYSGYSLGLQAKVAEALLTHHLGNVLAENPLVAKNLTWHRKLLTPFDVRLGLRHEAPLGDTHRWTSGADFTAMKPFYVDSPFLAELIGAEALRKATGPGAEGTAGLDWSSQAFAHFGAIFRHRFGDPEESFLTFKSGDVSGHYHNDNQTFHWYHRGTPIALDYNCSYHPRGDHAALHNGITLGTSGTLKHNARGGEFEAIEQPYGDASVTHFTSVANADLVVADRHIGSLGMTPIDPEDSEFNRDYPGRRIDADHRRFVLLAKQPKGSPLSDYLVVRDEFRTDEPQQVNLHLLARDARTDGNVIHLTGQWDQDILVVVVEATDLHTEHRQWAYNDEWMAPPEEFLPKPGESTAQWDARLPPERPKAGWKPTYVGRDQTGANAKRWHELLTTTDGMAMMPPPGWTSTWTYGECQRWLRFSSKPGTPVTMVIYPYARGTAEPTITRAGDVITIATATSSQDIRIGSDTGVRFDNTELLKPKVLPPFGKNGQ